MYEFRWNDWNLDHIAEHGMVPEDVEWIVNHAQPPYPERSRRNTYLVRGQTYDGYYMQVAFLLEDGNSVFVIHARPLSESEKRQFRRRMR